MNTNLDLTIANSRCDGKEWDKERSSDGNIDNPNVHSHTVTLFGLASNSGAVGIPPTAVETEMLEERDIVDTENPNGTLDPASHNNITESRLQNDTSQASNIEIVTAGQRASTLDIDTMEQGNLTNVLRRRNTPQTQAEVPLHNHIL